MAAASEAWLFLLPARRPCPGSWGLIGLDVRQSRREFSSCFSCIESVCLNLWGVQGPPLVLIYFQGRLQQSSDIPNLSPAAFCHLPFIWCVCGAHSLSPTQLSRASPGCSHSWGWSLDVSLSWKPPSPMTTPPKKGPSILREAGQWLRAAVCSLGCQIRKRAHAWV